MRSNTCDCGALITAAVASLGFVLVASARPSDPQDSASTGVQFRAGPASAVAHVALSEAGADVGGSWASTSSIHSEHGMVSTGQGWAMLSQPLLAGGTCETQSAAAVVLGDCGADLDRSGTIDLADALLFQAEFNAGSAGADLDRDGSLTIFDFIAFGRALASGCSEPVVP